MSTRLHEQIAELATYDDRPAAAGITREAYTPTCTRAVDLVGAWMRDVGLEVRLDTVGTLYGRWPGTEPDVPRVLTGSHLDTTRDAGRYDGVLGVVGALEAVRTLHADGFTPRRTLEVVAWAGEQPRFGVGCVGSRVAAGRLDRAGLEALVDRDGLTAAHALRDAGFDPARCADAVIDPATVHALVELHIEQGVVLQTHGQQIGVVTAIAAPHDFTLTFRGAAAHAGATPMDLRRDALAGAAEAMVELERLAHASSSSTTVATVGALRMAPGAIDVVPHTAALDVDVCDSDLAARDAVVSAIVEAAHAIAGRRGLEVEVTPIVEDVPVPCDLTVIRAVGDAAEDLGLRARPMVSGASHDAMVMGTRVPVGMIFVPSRAGVSHHPGEHTAPEELDAGVAVLAGTLARLAG